MLQEYYKRHQCQRCGQIYHAQPALSRSDNHTYICPDCGTREALESMGIEQTEQEKILKVIHKYD